jgi:hypothetical protein
MENERILQILTNIESMILYDTSSGTDEYDKISGKIDEYRSEVIGEEHVIEKLIKPIIDAIDYGCSKLGKKTFVFSKTEYKYITDSVKETINSNDGDSKERVVGKLALAIRWKADNAHTNVSEKKFWTKGFFTRKTKNNYSINLYHYERFLSENPYARVGGAEKVVSKEIEVTPFTKFDYGIELD